MKATGFVLQEVVNPNTSEVSQRIAVRFDNGKVIRLYHPDDSIESMVEKLKADKAEYAAKAVVRTGEYGDYVVFSRAKTLEEI